VSEIQELDYLSPAIQYRLKSSRSKREPLARAMGVKNERLRVLDATFGRGIDSLCLAQWGCQVTGLERNTEIYQNAARALLALQRVSKEAELIKLLNIDSVKFIAELENAQDQFDVIYLDPMYELDPRASAKPKKEIQELRSIVGADVDKLVLLKISLSSGVRRVVVKGPPGRVMRIETSEGVERQPTRSLIEKSVQLDIYIRGSMGESGGVI
jgi:16S rRNA (guanine1516-N2)-methyltransferase